MKTKIPENHQTVMPYLIVKNASGFMEFMKEVFGAKETFKQMSDEQHIMHAQLMLNNDSTIMLSDSTEQFEPKTAGMFIYVDDADATYKKALELGAINVMEMSDQSYGRSGGIQDPHGNIWWITSVV